MDFFLILGSPSHQIQQDTTYRLPHTSTSPVHLIQSVHPDPNINIPDVTLGLPPENYTFQGIFSSSDYNCPESAKNYSNSPLHSGNISPFTNSTSNSPIHQNLLYSSNNTSIYNPNPTLYNCANFVAYNPCPASSTISSITQGLSGLNTTSNPFQLELRNPPEEFKMDTCSYSNIQQGNSQSNYIIQNPLNYILSTHNHRSLTNSPISNPSSPGLDMIQEESSCHHNTIQIPIKQDPVSVCHPQISVTDVSGSEVTLIASSDTSEDSMDSLDNQKPQKIPSFIISEPAENQPSITRGIGRKTSTESNSEHQKFEENSEYYLRRNSDKSSCYSDDSLSNDSLSVGNFSPSSVSMQQPSTESDFDIRGTAGTPINQNFEKMQITHPLDNAEDDTDTVLDLSMPHAAPADPETRQQCTSSNLASALFNINQNLFDNSQKNSGSFEMQLSEVCSKLEPNDILELVKQTINNQIPPKHCVTKSAEEDYSDKLSLEYEGGLQIELKICEDKQRESKGLKVRRISGDHLVYNQLCQQLISCMTVS